MYNTIEEFDSEKLLKIFSNDSYHLKIFNKLLQAVITDDFSSLSSTPTELLYVYMRMREQVDKFITDHIYENLYESTAYNGLVKSLIDIYSVFLTLVYLRTNITNVDIQPDEIIDNYLDEFGFPSKHIFNYIQRREIARNIYSYLRKKGTPDLVKNILTQMGFYYFYIAEFWLYEKDTKNNENHFFVPDLIYERLPDKDAAGFFSTQRYTIEEIKARDPLWTLTDDDLNNEKLSSYPIKSPYYQIGITVSTSEMEKICAAIIYAVVKRAKYAKTQGVNINSIRFDTFSSKISFIDLVYIYTYIMGDSFGVFDPPFIPMETPKKRYDMKKKYDNRLFYDDGKDYGDVPIKEFLYDSGEKYDSFKNYDISGDAVPIDYYGYPLSFGWQKDVYTPSLSEIITDIRKTIVRLFKRVSWLPDIPAHGDFIKADTPLIRKNKILKEIHDTFYGRSLFGTYDETIKEFKESNQSLFNWIDSLMKKYERGSEEDFALRVEYLDKVFESMEYYIFDQSKVRVQFRQMAMSYDRIEKILLEIDKSFTPYHAKLIDPLVVFAIRDLPGDCFAADDSKIDLSGSGKLYDIVWRSTGYMKYDMPLPEPYAPIADWNPMYNKEPHVPNTFTKDQRISAILKNKWLYALGYDWTNNSEENPFIVQNKPYYQHSDWDADLLYSDNQCKLVSGYRINMEPKSSYFYLHKMNLKSSEEHYFNHIVGNLDDVRYITEEKDAVNFNRYDMPVISERMEVIHETK